MGIMKECLAYWAAGISLSECGMSLFIALNERLDEPDPEGSEGGNEGCSSCSPKAHLSKKSGHRTGLRVWGCGSLRSEEKDQCESPRIQRNFKRGVPQKCRFIPPPLQKDHIVLYSYYDRYTTTDVVTTGDASTVNIWQAGKEEGN